MRRALPRGRGHVRARGRPPEEARPLPAALLPGAAAGRARHRARRPPRGPARGPAVPRHLRRRDRGDGRSSSPAASASSSTATTSRTRSRRCSWPTTSTASTADPTSRARRWACSSTCSPAASTRSRASTGHVIGGMGAITQAMAAAARGFGARDPHERAGGAGGRARRAHARGRARGRDGDRERRPCSPTPTPSGRSSAWSDEAALPAEFAQAVRGIRMDGPCAKVNLVLGEEPRVLGHAGGVHAPASARCSRSCRRWSSRSAATRRPGAATSPTSCGWTAWWPRTWTPRWRRRAST